MAGSMTAPRRSRAAASHQPELKRVMGPKLLLLFIVGDILGTGIYAVTGNVAKEVGGAVWLPFLVAFVVATMTAFSYLELVTKYPQAAGAALYAHKAFGVHFFTFLVCFTVMCSGITSASTASRAFAANLAAMANVVRGEGCGRSRSSPRADPVLALLLHRPGGAVNLRGVAESVKANIVLTCVELSRPADGDLRRACSPSGQGKADFSRVVMFDTAGGQGDLPRRHRRHLPGLLRHGRLRGLGEHGRGGQGARSGSSRRSCSPAWASPGRSTCWSRSRRSHWSRRASSGEGEAPLIKVVAAGAPNLPIGEIFPLISMFAVANSALDQHDDGQPAALRDGQPAGAAAGARQGAGGSAYAVGGDPVHHRARRRPADLRSGAAASASSAARPHCCCWRCSPWSTSAAWCCARTTRQHKHFVAPTVIPIIGALCCAFLVGPWTGRNPVQYSIAGVLIAIGVVLWVITWFDQPGHLRAARPTSRTPRIWRATARAETSASSGPEPTCRSRRQVESRSGSVRWRAECLGHGGDDQGAVLPTVAGVQGRLAVDLGPWPDSGTVHRRLAGHGDVVIREQPGPSAAPPRPRR